MLGACPELAEGGQQSFPACWQAGVPQVWGTPPPQAVLNNSMKIDEYHLDNHKACQEKDLISPIRNTVFF
jgi:hypothetical protein